MIALYDVLIWSTTIVFGAAEFVLVAIAISTLLDKRRE